MAKNSWNDYSATAANNTDVGNVNTSETMNPSDVNDAVRELMSHTADVVAGTVALSSINIDGGSITGITDLAVADGGTGASTLTANGVLFGNGTSAIGVTAVGTSGQVLTSNGSSAPTFQDAATTYTHPNHSGEVTSTGDGATVIASNVVDEDNLKVSNSPTNGYILTARSGNTGGMTWEAAAGGGASDIDGLSDAITNSSGVTIGLGTGALANDDGSTNNNTALGYNSLNDNTSGYNNVALGMNALAQNTTANENTAVGYRSLTSNTTGTELVAVGDNAMEQNTTGSGHTAVGYQAARNATTASNNTMIGMYAGYTMTTGYDSVAVGSWAGLYHTTGFGNVFVGRNAGRGAAAGVASSGNVGIGQETLLNQSGGYGNVCVGRESGKAITSGNSNTFIGNLVNNSQTTTGSNNITLGANSTASSATVSNEVTFGNSSIASIRCQVQTISSLSDRRDKKDIEELPLGIDFINTLKPVKFTWNMRDGAKVGQQEAGFIAQDLDEAQIDAGAEDYLSLVLKNNPEKLEASYGKLVPVLVKAVQELSAEVATLKKEIENGK